MRLAEALLRVPDPETMALLLSDQLSQADFSHHHSTTAGSHPVFESLSAKVLHLAALADVRILIFDSDAPTLEGLPLYDP